VEVGSAQRCAPRLIRAWVRPDGLGRPAGPPRGPGGGRVNEPELSPSLVMLATETGVAWGLPYNVQPACDTRVAGRGRDLDGTAGSIRSAAHQAGKSPRKGKVFQSSPSCQAVRCRPARLLGLNHTGESVAKPPLYSMARSRRATDSPSPSGKSDLLDPCH
jgi:hypothetical protein